MNGWLFFSGCPSVKQQRQAIVGREDAWFDLGDGLEKDDADRSKQQGMYCNALRLRDTRSLISSGISIVLCAVAGLRNR